MESMFDSKNKLNPNFIFCSNHLSVFVSDDKSNDIILG